MCNGVEIRGLEALKRILSHTHYNIKKTMLYDMTDIATNMVFALITIRDFIFDFSKG